MSNTPTEFRLKPARAQREIVERKTRYLVAAIGRQFGKTTSALMHTILQSSKPGIIWWVAPTFSQARVAFDRLKSMAKPIIVDVNATHQEIKVGNAKIVFKGSDKPDNMRGETLDGAVLDECGVMKSDVWPEIIRPMLAVKKGWGMFLGTPKGKNWFSDLWDYSASGDPEWSRIHKRSVDSPFFSQDEWEAAKRSLPERVFRQEYEAEFLSDDSEVFRGVNDCILPGAEMEPEQMANYIIGVDLAKHVDWTVCTVWDTFRKQLVNFDRYNQIDWPMQVGRIVALARKYHNALVIVDATGVGDPIVDALMQADVNVNPVHLTNQVKAQIIQRLAFAIERREIKYPEIPELLNELRMFGFERLPSGAVRYGAPQGYHDDIVISMALAVNYLDQSEPISIGKPGFRR